MKFDGFIVALLISIAIAYFFPQGVEYRDGQWMALLTGVGVSLIFFFYGLKLSFSAIKSGLRNWKLHLVVQSATFVLFPLILLPFRPFLANVEQEHYWLSFFFLAALPSTVSSSVVMVSIARGNVPAAIFNASISGLIGVVVTPLWMGLFLDFHTDHVFADVYWGLIREIILPVILGLWLQRYFGMWANRHSKSLSLFDKTVILLIVYSSFAESFTSGVFEEVSRVYLVWVLVGVVVFFAVVYVLLWMLVKYVFRFTLADQITAIFCGSKKSLTHGSVFGKFLFVNNPLAGLYFLPIMLFHAFQIFVVTIIAQYYHTKEGLKE
ncbi:bile acid:sodium symporter [Parapedobacter sp. SGR-10]|uniref:bile acid:sodium symporter family protein n=1 Tax=Parapedobacter sp. SGR-10 TaxID=2710879 RepID=UPI0013D1D2DE|nr:bile acid:sodium symporter family protein [Parapedobacter sp. SGR-10]NGF57388.1 bile acid:sodium symporter [Parapedobacter sp. SGR-10]